MSVLGQTFNDFELIVVDDSSTDDTSQVVASFDDSSIQYIRHDQNRGLAAARNTGLARAHGKYVAYLDDDDQWLPDKLVKQVKLFETKAKDCAMVYCGALRIGTEGQILGKSKPTLCGDIRSELERKALTTIPSSCLFLRKALEEVGGYDETLTSHIDHDIWLQLAREGHTADYVDECLVLVHQHQDYRMTTDVESRVQATHSFCQKWQPELEDWFGRRDAQTYCSQFTARVMGMLGWACVARNDRSQGAKCFLLAVRHHLAKRSYYAGLVASAVGGTMYDRLIWIWNWIKE
jgi:glycosyltransferase involved in cell wall biosynthesis